MGVGGISMGSLIIILAIVIVLFGTKKVRHLGSDLGKAIKGFQEGIGQDNKAQNITDNEDTDFQKEQKIIDNEVKKTV